MLLRSQNDFCPACLSTLKAPQANGARDSYRTDYTCSTCQVNLSLSKTSQISFIAVAENKNATLAAFLKALLAAEKTFSVVKGAPLLLFSSKHNTYFRFILLNQLTAPPPKIKLKTLILESLPPLYNKKPSTFSDQELCTISNFIETHKAPTLFVFNGYEKVSGLLTHSSVLTRADRSLYPFLQTAELLPLFLRCYPSMAHTPLFKRSNQFLMTAVSYAKLDQAGSFALWGMTEVTDMLLALENNS